MGALYMGNRPFIKAATTVSIVIEQFLILLHHCGLPLEDVDLLHCRGSVMSAFLEMVKHDVRLVQFTGSSNVAEEISQILHGKVRIEDAGFDWKIIGPDYNKKYFDHVAWQCDQDAYAASGQKCSATSILFVHHNWREPQLLPCLAALANRRKLDNLTVGPVLSWTTGKIFEHVKKLSSLNGAYILFGGEELKDHSIPKCYGAIRPTAVFVPLKEIENNFELVMTEVFGPVQVITEYFDDSLPIVLDLCERMENHLTAAIVSNDPEFINRVLGSTVNGTTYVGMLARTTGAPQNHWFGPCGDPRGAGIGTDQAIRLTWSSPRCIIRDEGPINPSAKLVQS
jgi:1-pyrroline-5-carboxylate dehydrogenase